MIYQQRAHIRIDLLLSQLASKGKKAGSVPGVSASDSRGHAANLAPICLVLQRMLARHVRGLIQEKGLLDAGLPVCSEQNLPDRSLWHKIHGRITRKASRDSADLYIEIRRSEVSPSALAVWRSQAPCL